MFFLREFTSSMIDAQNIPPFKMGFLQMK